MRLEALDYLACPSCSADLNVEGAAEADGHIITGQLTCHGCQRRWPIIRGIPRFVDEVDAIEAQTAAAFGYEWTRYSELAGRYRKQFLDWIRPVEAGFFEGKAVLEGGCGKGRHTALAAEFGARAIVGVDLGVAVEAAFANTRHLEAAHIVQADLKRPPVKAVFDYAFSVGVLHHLPVPEHGFQSLVSKVRPGGWISAWVYGREGNGWIVHVVSPIRERVTTKLPHAVVDRISAAMTVPLFAATRLVYGPTRGRIGPVRMPYGEYLSYIAPFPFREQRSIVLDHLVAPVAHYIPRDEFASWFHAAGLDEVSIERHNGNSWRGFARVPCTPSQADVP